MAIDNDIYSQTNYGWWDSDPNSVTALLRSINPIRFAYFKEILKQKKGNNISKKSLLDVGCGGGYLSEEFAKMGLNVTGVDASPNSLSAACEHANKNGLHINYKEARAEELPFKNATFDYVSCCDVLEHVDNIKDTVSEIARVLKPGGIFFYDTINRTVLSFLLLIKIAQDWQYTAWEVPDTHEWRRFIKPSELCLLMKTNDLEMYENKGIAPKVGLRALAQAVRQRAKGEISRLEMAARFKLEKNDNIHLSYMGFAVKQ